MSSSSRDVNWGPHSRARSISARLGGRAVARSGRGAAYSAFTSAVGGTSAAAATSTGSSTGTTTSTGSAARSPPPAPSGEQARAHLLIGHHKYSDFNVWDIVVLLLIIQLLLNTAKIRPKRSIKYVLSAKTQVKIFTNNQKFYERL